MILTKHMAQCRVWHHPRSVFDPVPCSRLAPSLGLSSRQAVEPPAHYGWWLDAQNSQHIVFDSISQLTMALGGGTLSAGRGVGRKGVQSWRKGGGQNGRWGGDCGSGGR